MGTPGRREPVRARPVGDASSVLGSAGAFALRPRRVCAGRLEELDRVAGGGLEEDLPAAPGPLPVSLHPVGGGSQHVATVYADDLADLVLRALERGFGY